MLHLDDKITIAVGGPIKAGKDVLLDNASNYQETLFQSLRGNFWVPQQVQVISEEHNRALFGRYSADPQRYAFEFQVACLNNRLAQQSKVDAAQGLVFHGQPLEIDRYIYAEANRSNMGDSFESYTGMYEEIRKRVASPDLWIYLRVPEERLDIMLERIRTGGRDGEKKFLEDSSYLLETIRLNEEFFTKVVRQPVITIDATHPVFGGQRDNEYLPTLYQDIANQIRQYKKPRRLPLQEWEEIDYNRSQKGMREARRQLRRYLATNQSIIAFAGLVGISKTSMAELLSAELDIEVMLELSGKHNAIADELLDKFLRDKKTYAYDLQKSLIPKRIGMRKEKYALGKSFVEDRSPVEDQSIFWRRLHQQGNLSDDQMRELTGLAKQAYATAPKSNLMIKLLRSPEQCREMILRRGRQVEIDAWPIEDLKEMEVLYRDFFEDMEQYKSHDGPTLELDVEYWDAKNTVHWGYLFQEMFHNLLEWEERKKQVIK